MASSTLNSTLRTQEAVPNPKCYQYASMRPKLFQLCDPLLVGWIDPAVRIRAHVDATLKEVAENFDLFLRQRAANASTTVFASPLPKEMLPQNGVRKREVGMTINQ